jgi:hypothetical protein
MPNQEDAIHQTGKPPALHLLGAKVDFSSSTECG